VKEKILIGIISLIILSCDDKKSNNLDIDPNFDTPDWTEDSHSDNGQRNYDMVFPQNNVNRIDIIISENNWQKMIDDMTEKYGPFG